MATKVKQSKTQVVKGGQIKLSRTVVVSDPCYKIPTWCQAVVKNVKAGKYNTFVIRSDEDSWGIRNSVLVAINSEYEPATFEDFKWTEYPAEIGVDSGQCGIFSSASYRSDDVGKSLEYVKGKPPFDFGELPVEEDGGHWYNKMCDLTLTPEEHFGTYSEGVVTSSGLGDGGYELFVAKENGRVVGFLVHFGLVTTNKSTLMKIIKNTF